MGSSSTSYNFGQGLVCRRSPQLHHLNLGPVLLGCCPLLISLSLWPQCLLALSANYQPKIYFIRGLSCPRRTWTDFAGVRACVCKTCRGRTANMSRVELLQASFGSYSSNTHLLLLILIKPRVSLDACKWTDAYRVRSEGAAKEIIPGLQDSKMSHDL